MTSSWLLRRNSSGLPGDDLSNQKHYTVIISLSNNSLMTQRSDLIVELLVHLVGPHLDFRDVLVELAQIDLLLEPGIKQCVSAKCEVG